MSVLVGIFVTIAIIAKSEIDLENYQNEVCTSSNNDSNVHIHPEQKQFSFNNYPVLNLPLINIGKYLHGTNNEKREIIESFKYYISTLGTVGLTNHSVPHSLIDTLFDQASLFFDRSTEYKMEFLGKGLGTSGYDYWKSYAGASAYGIKDQPPDLADDFALYNHDGLNKWHDYGPIKLPSEFEYNNITKTYIAEMDKLLSTLNELASESLGIDKQYFNSIYNKSPGKHLRFFNYPPLNLSKVLPTQMRVSQHKDYLAWTIYTWKGRGSQMRFGKKLWLDVDKGSVYNFAINTGEIIELLTNGYYVGNYHRVIPLNNHRYTISFLTGPNQDEVLKPIQGCYVCTKDDPKFVERTAKQQGALRYNGADRNEFFQEGKAFFADDL